MHTTIILVLILVFLFISRFFQIGFIPPLTPGTPILLRYINVMVSVGICILMYFYTKKRTQNRKESLLAAWVFSVLFWPLEQGRIVSQVNISVFFLLIYLIHITSCSLKTKIFSTFILVVVLFFIYPQLWIFKLALPKLSIDLVNNFIAVASFEFLFFKNQYFWWGGVRDFGILNLTFLPFFLIGIFQIIYDKDRQIIFGSLILILLTAMSPYFPETREFYLATPFFSYIIAAGIYKFRLKKNFMRNLLMTGSLIFLMYELSQYFHYYTIHYYMEVRGNLSKIHEAF